MRPEQLWRKALDHSERAQAAGALIPLRTELVELPGLAPFQMRRLLSQTPKHLLAGGPKPNPFLPWEPALELETLGRSHALILNKFPVQAGHVLLITQSWQAQAGWLTSGDWQAVAHVAADTGGLWFFNSAAASGASQPHRHLQLLPRHDGQASCPLDGPFEQQLSGCQPSWPWSYAISRRQDPLGNTDLEALYRAHAERLGLGNPANDLAPLHPYNLLFNDRWFVTVRRRLEHCAGFSLNALGFAGYLLATDRSDLAWLEQNGPLNLLREVASPAIP